MSPAVAAHTMIRRKSKERLAAEARARGMLLEQARLGSVASERLQLRRRAERLERVRARTRAAVIARETHQPGLDDRPAQMIFQFEESK